MNSHTKPNKPHYGGPPMVRIEGGRVRQLREQQGLTQLYVATAVGVTTDTISRWENKKYPSVKKENALKLAETLEVELEDILDMPEDKASLQEPDNYSAEGDASPHGDETREDTGGAGKSEEQQESRLPVKRSKMPRAAAIFLVIVALATGIMWYYLHNHGQPAICITATRFLPEHVPPGAPFPVIISVACVDSTKLSLILTEHIPAQADILKAIPPWSASSPDRKKIKWITATSSPEITICYMAAAQTGTETGTELFFSGDVTSSLGGRSTCTVKGAQSMTLAPFHWADRNRDGQIDDEEILRVFDQLGRVKGIDSSLNDIKRIWSSGRYRWDHEQHRYVTDNINLDQEFNSESGGKDNNYEHTNGQR